jgi:hypothetical protein
VGHGHKNDFMKSQNESGVVKSFKSLDNKPFERNLTYSLYPGFAVKRTCHKLKSVWIDFRTAYRECNNEKMNYYAEGMQKVLKAVEQQQTPQSPRDNN